MGMKTVKLLVEIKIDENNIGYKYPNYNINWNSPEEFITYLANDLEKDHLKDFGYEIKVISREEQKLNELEEDAIQDNHKKINITELASELASLATGHQWEIVDQRPENILVEEDNGDTRFNSEAQEIFNEYYDNYYTIISNHKP